MAARLRSLRASVQMATRCTCHCSNAWVSNSNFASEFTAVRCASLANQVPPISTSLGAALVVHHRNSMNRVQPTTRWSATRRCANATALPRSLSATKAAT